MGKANVLCFSPLEEGTFQILGNLMSCIFFPKVEKKRMVTESLLMAAVNTTRNGK